MDHSEEALHALNNTSRNPKPAKRSEHLAGFHVWRLTLSTLDSKEIRRSVERESPMDFLPLPQELVPSHHSSWELFSLLYQEHKDLGK